MVLELEGDQLREFRAFCVIFTLSLGDRGIKRGESITHHVSRILLKFAISEKRRLRKGGMIALGNPNLDWKER